MESKEEDKVAVDSKQRMSINDIQIESNLTGLQKLMLACHGSLTFIQRASVNGMYLVIPYYVLATPSKGWSASDLSIIFVMQNVGTIIGSQIISITSLFSTNNNTAIFIGHLFQFLCGIIAWILLSSFMDQLEFNFGLFVVGSLLNGIGCDITSIQQYGDIISKGNIECMTFMMSNIGKIVIISGFICSFMLPTIYDSAGFEIFCVVQIIIQCIGLAIFLILWFYINYAKNTQNDGTQGDDQQDKDDEFVRISLKKLLSPSMFVLLFTIFCVAFKSESYAIAYPILFSTEWNISSSVAGYLGAASMVFAYFTLTAILSFTKKSKICRYPYNITMPIIIWLIGCTMIVAVNKPIIAYIFHWQINGLGFLIMGLELVVRLSLCPSEELAVITRYKGFITPVAFLLGSAITPILTTIYIKLPFIIIIVLNVIVIIIIMIVYWRRTMFLSTFYEGDDYLCNERINYQRVRSSSRRRHNISVSHNRESVEFISDLNDFISNKSSMCLFGNNCDAIRKSVVHRRSTMNVSQTQKQLIDAMVLEESNNEVPIVK